MKSLTMIRHAKSSWKQVGLDDFARPLNQRGKRDATDMGKRLAAIGFMPDAMISSPAKRAQSTSKRMAREFGYAKARIELERHIYHATREQLLQVVQSLDDSIQHAALVGHNPGFTELSSFLSKERIGDLPTCAVVRLQLEVLSWDEVGRKCGVLIDFDYPKRATTQGNGDAE